MNTPAQLLDRLEAIGASLARTDGALALIGLGSVGLETERLDEYSDLDFFVIVETGAKERFLADRSWLAGAAPIVFLHRDTPDGLRLLYADGIYGEMAVFEPDQLARAAFAPGRVVWQRAPAGENPAVPVSAPPAPLQRSGDWLLGEILCNLYVGLQLYGRGERLAAAREIQLYALERMLELAPFLEAETPSLRDPFAPMRRFERRFPTMAAALSRFQPGYDRTPQSAAAMLEFLEARFELNDAMVRTIRGLLRRHSPESGDSTRQD